MEKTIELDCPPGSPRPTDLIAGVLKDTGLEVKKPIGALFGNFTWDYSEVSDEKWVQVQEITRPRIQELYNRGFIRYGSW